MDIWHAWKLISFSIWCPWFIKFLPPCLRLRGRVARVKLKWVARVKLSFPKFAIDSQNTQTQNSSTQKIENSNPNWHLWVFLGAYVRVELKSSVCQSTHLQATNQQAQFTSRHTCMPSKTACEMEMILPAPAASRYGELSEVLVWALRARLYQERLTGL